MPVTCCFMLSTFFLRLEFSEISLIAPTSIGSSVRASGYSAPTPSSGIVITATLLHQCNCRHEDTRPPFFYQPFHQLLVSQTPQIYILQNWSVFWLAGRYPRSDTYINRRLKQVVSLYAFFSHFGPRPTAYLPHGEIESCAEYAVSAGPMSHFSFWVDHPDIFWFLYGEVHLLSRLLYRPLCWVWNS